MPAHDDLLNLDFNALRTLRLVYRLGSFSAAAEAIEVKQSTVSYTIDRIRKAVGDPLFVRQGGRTAPTARCRDLIPVVDRILAEADNLDRQSAFDPARARAEISVICSTFGLQVLLPGVFRRLRVEAPGIRLNLMQRFQGVSRLLLDGEADLALVSGEIEQNGIYGHVPLFKDVAVCIMDPANPLVGQTLTKRQLAEARHIRGHLWANWKMPYVAAAEKLGIRIEPYLTVADQMHVPTYIRGTDLVGGMPSALARSFGDRLGIAYFPFDVPVELNMYWSATSNHSPLNSWLRGIIVEETGKLSRQQGGLKLTR